MAGQVSRFRAILSRGRGALRSARQTWGRSHGAGDERRLSIPTCPYQKLHLHREKPPTACHQAREHATPETETRVTPSLWTTEVRGCTTAGVRASTPGQTAPRATVRRRDVRSGDANRRRVGLGRSRRRMALEQPAGRAHPCPVRGEFATRDSTRGSAAGGGATSARSTR